MSRRGLPAYRRTADEILAMIASGKLGHEFTVPEAAKLSGAKPWAARKAAEHLAERGLIEPHQGSGYRAQITPEEAAAARADDRTVRDQVAKIQQEVAALRQQVTELDGRVNDLWKAETRRVKKEEELSLAPLAGRVGISQARTDRTIEGERQKETHNA